MLNQDEDEDQDQDQDEDQDDDHGKKLKLHIGVLALQGAFREHIFALERVQKMLSELDDELDNYDVYSCRNKDDEESPGKKRKRQNEEQIENNQKEGRCENESHKVGKVDLKNRRSDNDDDDDDDDDDSNLLINQGRVIIESISEIRRPEQLDDIDALVFPGGESTAIAWLARKSNLLEPLRKWVLKDHKPVFGTCAGMIMLSDEATGLKAGGQELIGGLHVSVMRNYFGSQLGSFSQELRFPDQESHFEETEKPYQAVFIRAPAVQKINDTSVKILAQVCVDSHSKEAKGDSKSPVVVAVEQENILATAFHPELTEDDRWHRHFIEMTARWKLKQMI